MQKQGGLGLRRNWVGGAYTKTGRAGLTLRDSLRASFSVGEELSFSLPLNIRYSSCGGGVGGEQDTSELI